MDQPHLSHHRGNSTLATSATFFLTNNPRRRLCSGTVTPPPLPPPAGGGLTCVVRHRSSAPARVPVPGIVLQTDHSIQRFTTRTEVCSGHVPGACWGRARGSTSNQTRQCPGNISALAMKASVSKSGNRFDDVKRRNNLENTKNRLANKKSLNCSAFNSVTFTTSQQFTPPPLL